MSMFQDILYSKHGFSMCRNPQKAMVSLFNGNQSELLESLDSLHYSFLSKKVATAKSFVKPERLPPTSSSAKLHCRRTCLQVMQWMGKDDDMNPSEWGWDVQRGKLVPLMLDRNPAPDELLKMIRCNCSVGCITMRRSCRRKMDLNVCQFVDIFCENTVHESVSDDEVLDE